MAKASKYRHENTGTAWWLNKDLEVGPYDDPELRPLAERCLLTRSAAGPPALPAMYNNLKRIVQTDDYLMINIEWMHDTRIIPIVDKPESPDADMPRWLGTSVAHWDGDTLVVETTGFMNDTAATATADPSRRVVERFSRIDGDRLRYAFTVYDPNHAETWSGEYPWPETEHRMYEYACHEGNYALGGILRGARILEADVEGAGDSP